MIAALLAFILARRLRGFGLWNAPSVIVTVALAMVALSALATTIALQVTQLAEDLPKYEAIYAQKVRVLSGSPAARERSIERRGRCAS